jgi:hypothetical protein
VKYCLGFPTSNRRFTRREIDNRGEMTKEIIDISRMSKNHMQTHLRELSEDRIKMRKSPKEKAVCSFHQQLWIS